MTLARQPSPLPTNKALTVAALAPALALYVEPVAAELWPQIAPTILTGPETTAAVAWLLSALASLAVAWWVPDQANVPRDAP